MHPYFYYPNNSMMFGTGDNFVGFIIHLALWVLIIGLVIAIIKGITGHGHDHDMHTMTEEDYIDIIKRRYAKGEIDKKEYEQLKKDLE